MTPEQFCYWLQGFSELLAQRGTPWNGIQQDNSTTGGKHGNAQQMNGPKRDDRMSRINAVRNGSSA